MAHGVLLWFGGTLKNGVAWKHSGIFFGSFEMLGEINTLDMHVRPLLKLFCVCV